MSRSHSPRTHPVGGGVSARIWIRYAEQRYDTTGTTTYWVFLNNLGVVKLHQWRQVSQPLDRGLVPSHGSYVTRSHRIFFFLWRVHGILFWKTTDFLFSAWPAWSFFHAPLEQNYGVDCLLSPIGGDHRPPSPIWDVASYFIFYTLQHNNQNEIIFFIYIYCSNQILRLGGGYIFSAVRWIFIFHKYERNVFSHWRSVRGVRIKKQTLIFWQTRRCESNCKILSLLSWPKWWWGICDRMKTDFRSWFQTCFWGCHFCYFCFRKKKKKVSNLFPHRTSD